MAGTWRTQPDYFPLTVTNTIFGGQFLSRLNMNLREDKGYTYGARSTLEWRVREPGTIVAAASVQTRVTAPALVEFLKELRDIAGPRPVGPDELARGQRFLVRGYPANFETSSQVAEQLETLATYRLPGDYFNTVVPKLNAVTTADVLQTAKKYFKLDRLTIDIVGDRAAIEADLGKLPEAKNLAVLQFDEDFRLVPGK
jgi:predicted Zn-dependent peptidase